MVKTPQGLLALVMFRRSAFRPGRALCWVLIGWLILTAQPSAMRAAPPLDAPPGDSGSRAGTLTWPQSPGLQEPAGWSDLPPEVRAKVDPRILEELNGAIIPAHLGGAPDQAVRSADQRQPLERTRFLVYLKPSAGLRPLAARAYPSVAARRAAVTGALITTAQATQAPVKAVLDASMASGGVVAYQSFYIFNGFAVEGNLASVIQLALRDDVQRIQANYPLVPLDPIPPPASSRSGTGEPDADLLPPRPGGERGSRVRPSLGGLDPANWNIDLVDAERAWTELGVRGEGAVVGDFDTGVEWTHPALQRSYRGYSPAGVDHDYNWFEPNSVLYPAGDLGPSESDEPYDCDAHGTHTMGTMVGDGGTATTHVGVAPGARWIASPGLCSNTMPGGLADEIGGHKAFQWFLCPTDLSGALDSRDCSQAPDVVNNSWGSSNPADDTFRPDIQALRAAGIVPVFAAGNPSAGAGSIGSPASVPEAVSVGATDIEDQVASFSGRGPSAYAGEQKPELAAPGVDVNSTVPGGGYSGPTWSGTSMAAPAVSGLAALLVSADLRDSQRDLRVDEIEAFMEFTAEDLGLAGPDYDYGYGRIDAYNAVRWALTAGDLRGKVRDAHTGQPIPGAAMRGVSTTSDDTFVTQTDAAGAYSTTVPGGSYHVTLSAFGYDTRTFPGVNVRTGTASIVDFNLVPQPTALLTGTIRYGAAPVTGALVSVDAAPAVSFTTGSDGVYRLMLPIGQHALTVRASGYRIAHASAALGPGGASQDVAMTPAPRILLVEADASQGWFYGRPVHNFFQMPLDKRDYLYDLWFIEYTDFQDRQVLPDGSTGHGIPSPATLGDYDLVIWAHSFGMPAEIGAEDELAAYLEAGGRLILSGQNIGEWSEPTPFYQDYLHAVLLNTMAASEGDSLVGRHFLDDIRLTLTGGAVYGYPNSPRAMEPNAVSPLDGNAAALLEYNQGSGPAALAVDACNAPYRAVYLAVGYENLAPRDARDAPAYADVLDRSIQWAVGSKPAYGAGVTLKPTWRSGEPGETLVYELTVANLGVNEDSYSLSLTGNAWPMRILDGETEVTSVGPLGPCSSQTLLIEVAIPATANIGDSDTFTLTAVSQADPAVAGSVTATTLASVGWDAEPPMPTPRIRLAAAALPGTPYYYAIGGEDIAALVANERFDACTHTWSRATPLPEGRANMNAAELNGKIYVVGGEAPGPVYYASTFVYDPAADAWSRAADLPAPLSGVALAAAGGKLYAFGGAGSGGESSAVYVYDPGANTWAARSPLPGGPRSAAAAAALGGKIYVAGGRPDPRRVDVYDPAADAWSPAAALNFGSQSPNLVAAPDGYLYLTGDSDEVGSPSQSERYDPASNTWIMLPQFARVDADGSASAFAAGRVFVVGGSSDPSEPLGHESLPISSAFCVSDKQASPVLVQPGDPVTYTITLYSDTAPLPNAGVVDPLPPGTRFGGFGPATVDPAPVYNPDLERVEWRGSLPTGSPPVTFTFSAILDVSGWVTGQAITNTATFDDGAGYTFERSAVAYASGFVDLSPSTKRVVPTQARPGDVLTYTLRVQTAAPVTTAIQLSDPIPDHTSYVPGSLTYTLGVASFSPGPPSVTWQGSLPAPGVYVNRSNGYEWGDSDDGGAVPGVFFDWQDMAGATDTQVNSDDGTFGPFPIGFRFDFYGARHRDFYVSPNGWVGFDNVEGGIVNCATYGDDGLLDNFIGGFGGDRAVYADDGGSITYKLFGTRPRRYLVVQFTHMRYEWFSPADSLDMQIILYEGNNAILVQYNNLSDSPTTAATGIDAFGVGHAYLLYPDRCPADIREDLAVLFLPSGRSYTGQQRSADITFAVRTDQPLAANTWITNTATFTNSRGAVYQRSAGTLINSVDLSGSTKRVDRAVAWVGDPLTYTLVLSNSGIYTATGASLVDPIPNFTAWNGLPPVCSSGACGHTTGAITWTGDIPPGESVRITFGVTYTARLSDGTPITNTAGIDDGTGQRLERQAVFLAGAPDLAGSSIDADPLTLGPGGVVTYTLSVYNSGSVPAVASLSDALPSSLDYVPGSLIYGSGSGGFKGGVITWTGTLPAQSQTPIRFQAGVDSMALPGQVITNTALITDETAGLVYTRQVAISVQSPLSSAPRSLYLPVIVKPE